MDHSDVNRALFAASVLVVDIDIDTAHLSLERVSLGGWYLVSSSSMFGHQDQNEKGEIALGLVWLVPSK